MSAFLTVFPKVVRAVITDVGLVVGESESATQIVGCKALWDTGAVASVIDRLPQNLVFPQLVLAAPTPRKGSTNHLCIS